MQIILRTPRSAQLTSDFGGSSGGLCTIQSGTYRGKDSVFESQIVRFFGILQNSEAPIKRVIGVFKRKSP